MIHIFQYLFYTKFYKNIRTFVYENNFINQ